MEERMRRTGKAPTMNDVAHLAGVTQATVSYVINNTVEISEAVKKRVLDAANELGYIPNVVARNLKMRKTNTIGIIVPDVMNNYYSEMIKYAEKITREQGYFTFICNTMHDGDIEDWYITALIQQKVAGVIICYGLTNRECYNKLFNYRIPFVDLDDETGANEAEAPCVLLNNIKGSFLVVQHFISLGIKDIAYISEPLYNLALKDRYEGYKRAMKEFGLPINNDMVFVSEDTREYEKIQLGYVAAKEILSKSRPSGIFAATDQIAFGVIKRLNEAKIRIPENVAVVGYDNVPFSSVVVPSLTTINQPVMTMCIQGAQMLFGAIKGEPETKKKIMLEPSIVIRESAP
jgi:LacI family transcriptional regulator